MQDLVLADLENVVESIKKWALHEQALLSEHFGTIIFKFTEQNVFDN